MRDRAERGHEVQGRPSRWRLGLLVASLAVLAIALMPGSASAQAPAPGVCDGTLRGEGNRAELTFQCDFDVDQLEIRSNKDVLLAPARGEEGPEGFICLPPIAQGPDQNQGEPNNFGDPTDCAGNLAANTTATGTIVAQDVCDPLELRITARHTDTMIEDTFDVEIRGCPDGGPGDGGGGNGGGDPDEDSGTTPSGGVQSGAGGTADDGGSALMPVGLGLILAGTLGLGAVGLVRRRA